ncbi:MAG: hypothetical protein IAE97_12360 [Chthoniobacterales bacterium]|nr:hypothetical protein [Chthoniobacterales bacterium]
MEGNLRALPGLREQEAGLRLAKKHAVVLFTIWKRREPHQPFPALA